MIHRTTSVIINAKPDDDILFITKCTRNGIVTTRRATFLSYDKLSAASTNTRLITTHFATFLREKLERMRDNEVLTIEITNHQHGI